MTIQPTHPNLYFESRKAPNQCFGFEWKECQNNPLDILVDTTCPVVGEQIEIETEPVRIELDDSLLKSFNELSEDELEYSFGTFTPVQSLNPYMTKISLCSITEVGLSYKVECIFPIVISSEFCMRQHSDEKHREYALQFNMTDIATKFSCLQPKACKSPNRMRFCRKQTNLVWIRRSFIAVSYFVSIPAIQDWITEIFNWENHLGTMSWNFCKDEVQFVIEIKPELELFLGIGLVRNEEYVGLYFNLTAWSDHVKGTVQLYATNSTLVGLSKVGCIFPIVIWSEFRMGQYRDDYHREDALFFNLQIQWTEKRNVAKRRSRRFTAI